jgi:hypothetical protein
MTTVNFRVADGITPELKRIAAQMKSPRRLMAALGKRLEIDLRKHFNARNAEPNARGWPKQNIWRKEVAMHTALTEATDSRAVVTVASPAFAHKVFGGTVTPKRAKALSIPLTAAAYAAGSASLFPGKLKYAPGRLLDEAGIAQYALVKSVTHRPDPKAWPEQAKLEASLLARARALLARILRPRG